MSFLSLLNASMIFPPAISHTKIIACFYSRRDKEIRADPQEMLNISSLFLFIVWLPGFLIEDRTPHPSSRVIGPEKF